MGVGMGMAGWEWVGMKTPHYPIYLSQVADHQTQLMDPSFCIVICRIDCRLGLGMGIEINHLEWEGVGLKKIFPLISIR